MAANKIQDQGGGVAAPDRLGPAARPQPGHDLTVQTAMQMQKSLREVTARMDGLANDVGRLGRRLDAVEKNISFVRIGAAVLIVVIAAVLWWATHHHLAAAQPGLSGQPQLTTTENPPQAGSPP
ncbi:MAG: hypothetical protein FWD68_18590 [Alphaproteobacteria bacterium]|nr:hypothetical protein [Alphaproteobacteria bacterium]